MFFLYKHILALYVFFVVLCDYDDRVVVGMGADSDVDVGS